MVTIQSVPNSNVMAPVLICDNCGTRLVLNERNSYHYILDTKTMEVMAQAHLHGECFDAYRMRHPDHLPRYSWFWVSLTSWWEDLAANMQENADASQ